MRTNLGKLFPLTPIARQSPVKATIFEYFKRFPNQRFHSHDRRNPLLNPPKQLFTEPAQEQATIERSESLHARFRGRLLRQAADRDSIPKKRASEQELLERAVNKNYSLHKREVQREWLTPLDVLRNFRKALTKFEREEILQYEQIYYYGQNKPVPVGDSALEQRGEQAEHKDGLLEEGESTQRRSKLKLKHKLKKIELAREEGATSRRKKQPLEPIVPRKALAGKDVEASPKHAAQRERLGDTDSARVPDAMSKGTVRKRSEARAEVESSERTGEKADGHEEKDDCYVWSPGDQVAYRFELLALLGEGSFGQVFRCLDHKHGRQAVALKVVRRNPKYEKQARVEIEILRFIKERDREDCKNCVRMLEHFEFRGQVVGGLTQCITFALMSMNLYELIQSNGYDGLPLDLVRRLVLQLLNAVHFLHKHRLVHADLKPENVLLKEPNKSGVKLIDFGSSCFEGATVYTYIQSRYYRAPEVILGLPYDRRIDLWSLGCLFAELHLGYPLFAGEDEHEQLYLISQVIGKTPAPLLVGAPTQDTAKRTRIFFDDQGEMLVPKNCHELAPKRPLAVALNHPPSSFVDFISKCLRWFPSDRLEALELLQHPWVLEELPADFLEQHMRFIQEEKEWSRSMRRQQSLRRR